MKTMRVDDAVRFASAVLQQVGATPEHAAITAENLVFADRSGIASHGLLRLPLYAQAVDQGGINKDPQLRWVNTAPGGAVLEADGAFGQVAMDEATRFAAEELTRTASVVVAVQGSSHFGAGAFWVNRLAAEGFIAVATSSTGPVVAPFGGGQKVLGTNPLSISLPTATEEPLTVDMATSTGAYGKVVAARNAGEPVPEGWAVNSKGESTTDAEEALAGALTPFGGHKGSGIAVALEGLSAVLSQSSYAYETEDIWVNPASRMNVGHTLIAINPEAFTGLNHAQRRTNQLRDTVRASGHGVVSPGDMEATARKSNVDHIHLVPSTVQQLQDTAAGWGVEAPVFAD